MLSNVNDIFTISQVYLHRINSKSLIHYWIILVKLENFQSKILDIFLIFVPNIDCGYTLEPPRRGGPNEYPHSMFWSKNKTNRFTPAYPIFAI